MIDIAEKTGGRKYVGTEKVGVTYSQSGYHNFLSSGVAIGGGIWLSLLDCWSSQNEFQRESWCGYYGFVLGPLVEEGFQA